MLARAAVAVVMPALTAFNTDHVATVSASLPTALEYGGTSMETFFKVIGTVIGAVVATAVCLAVVGLMYAGIIEIVKLVWNA
jgi:hypothetical protein